MIKNIIIEIIVAFFPKHVRPELRHRLRYLGNVLYVKRTAKSVGKNFRCGKDILINKRTYIGDHVSINGIMTQGCGKTIIGNYCQTGVELLVLTSSHDYECDKIPYGDNENARDVIIGDCCWIGSRVTLLPGTELGEGCIVQAGAVVHGKFPPGSIIGGNPAVVFKQRNMENYYRNKEKGSFLMISYFK